MESIKDLMIKAGLDPDRIVHLQYKKAEHHLGRLVLRTEKTLIKIQEVDGMDVVSPRQKDVEQTLNTLLFTHQKMVQMQGIIYSLNLENELLKERLKIRK